MRASGILMHIASLPNDYGIGKLGHEAYNFADFLKKSGQHYWQILPLSQTGYGDSPYQSFSVYAGNPYFISFEMLEENGLLEKSEYTSIKWCESQRYIDYSTLYENVYEVLKKAFERFKKALPLSFKVFKDENKEWLDNYALFMALKSIHGGKPWVEWEESLRMREPKAVSQAERLYADEIEFQRFIQFKFYEQWNLLKEYVNSNGMEIIGDIPIYTAYDSADVWCEPELFQLDENRVPTVVAGFPPDGFAIDGQLWGNPIYDWDKMKQTDYNWWVSRMSFAKKIYDIVRIDHFIGFDRYYAIPYDSKSAHDGKWKQGPAYDLFRTIKEKTGNNGIIAEDLGIITPSVRKMLRQAGYPGMKVLQSAFSPDGKSEYLPQNFKSPNCIVYTSTHDSDTVAGWFKCCDKNTKRFCKDYLKIRRSADAPNAFIELAWKSSANAAIAAMQDLCGYDSEARMNVPSTLGNNWRWRALQSDFSDEKAEYLKHLTVLANRNDF